MKIVVSSICTLLVSSYAVVDCEPHPDKVSSLRSPRTQPISCLKETNLTYLDALDGGTVIEEIKEGTDIREHQEVHEAIRELWLWYHLLVVSWLRRVPHRS